MTTYSGADTVTGDGNANVIITNSGADSLIGEGGNDRLEAGSGNDTLRGGTGADVYIGGSGNDAFWFETGLGHDVVNDFAAGSAVSDVLRLQSLGVSSLSQVLAISTQVGADTVVSFDADSSITLLNVTKTNLHTNDFLFS